MPERYVEGVYPYFIEHAKGAFVYDPDGKRYIDLPCALGAIILGYADDYVNERITAQLRAGTLFSLPHRLEGQLAERIIDLIPCAEMVRFLKTGSEADSAAVRIARAFTGRENILSCGYNGWHDTFAIAMPRKLGIPNALNRLCTAVDYNDLQTFEDLIDSKTAAVILEPYMFTPPTERFLEKLVEVAHKHGTLVIFDEVITGLRTPGGSAQKLFGVTPDLATFGKAFGNGAPISFVCGRRDIMEVLTGDCFVSSTFGGDLIGMAAAMAVLDVWKKLNVDERIAESGYTLKRSFNMQAQRLKLEAVADGFNCRTRFAFKNPDQKTLFWQEAVKRGVLLGDAQFTSMAHTPEIVSQLCSVIDEALEVVAQYADPKEALEGTHSAKGIRDENVGRDGGRCAGPVPKQSDAGGRDAERESELATTGEPAGEDPDPETADLDTVSDSGGVAESGDGDFEDDDLLDE